MSLADADEVVREVGSCGAPHFSLMPFGAIRNADGGLSGRGVVGDSDEGGDGHFQGAEGPSYSN